MAPLWALVMAAVALPQVRTSPYFIVVAPDKIRPYSEYVATVSLYETTEPVTVTVCLKGVDKGNDFSKSTKVTVQPNSTERATIKVDALKTDNYNVTVCGDDNFKFENHTEIRFAEKYQSIFIQTDKAMYKPGHRVQFRVLLLDAHLKPSKMNKLDIILKDGQNNRVKEWKNVETAKGVFSSEIQLSPYPVLGDWTIQVKANGQEKTKTFTVAEYVLPKFEVFVEVPPHATFANSKVPVTVYAKYTYGQLVKGEAAISVAPQYAFYKEEPKPNSKVIKVDTKGQTEIDIVETLGLKEEQFYEREIIFSVSFTEELTGKILNGSASLRLHQAKYKIEFVRTDYYLTPGKPYTTQVKIVNWDDTPLPDTNQPVKVRHGDGWSERENATWENYTLPSNGLLDLTFETTNETNTLVIEVEYSGVSVIESVSKRYIEPSSGSDLVITLSNETPAIGDTIDVDVTTSGNTPFIVYNVIGRNEISDAKIVPVAEGADKVKLSVLIAPTMAPQSNIVVASINQKGELIAAQKSISVSNVMNNIVKLSAKPNETEPGQETVINIESKPNSLIGLMGIDQSVILLKSGNDLSKSVVENDLREYNNAWYGRPFGKRSVIGWYPGNSARDAFNGAGTVVLTNAIIPEIHYPLYSVAFGAAAPQAASAFGAAPPGEVLLMAGAPAPAPGPAPSSPPPRIRSQFPETWIWDALDSGSEGKTSVRKVVPDTITSWVITGFSISPEYGLGLSEDPAKVRVFRPFFISLNLPYSITREESISLPVNVFNYMDKEVTADVTLENPGWFVFATNESVAQNRKKRDGESSRTKSVTIGANSAATASFVITPKQLGYLEVKVTATSPVAGDGVSLKLLVKPEGETQYRSKGLFVDLRNTNEFKADVTLDIPDDIVPDSELIEVSAVGDLLGSALQNIDKLIRQPYGCGEQNMLNFVPNIVILDYLTNSAQLTDEIKNKAIKFLEMGYQRELTYKHKDNSYSAFGESDPSGSTWLTAFVAKSYKQAQRFIDIENAAVIEPLKWIASKQNSNGSFSEVGHVSHKSMQGGAANGLALTAYVLTAFVETMDLTGEFKDNIDRAAKYVTEQLETNTADTYSIAVASYALNLAGHPMKDKAFELLNSKAKTKGDTKWWEKEVDPNAPQETPNPWESWIPNSINVEITAYGMMNYLLANMSTEAIPILKWLLTQQNSDGGFASTQDTVVALGAIANLAKHMGGKGKSIEIQFTYPPSGTTTLNVNDDNALLLQKAELPSRKVRQVNVTAKGSGFAIVQVSYRYNVNEKGAFPSFNLNPQVDKASTKDHLILTICTNYTGGKDSNMAVMEVTLPSGYTIDSDAVKALSLYKEVKKVETKDEDTVVILYFDKVSSENICPTLSAFRTFKVAKQRPVPVTIYDYYDSSKRATEFYQPPAIELCDICEGDDCLPCENQL